MLKKITSLLLLATLFLFWNDPASAKTFDFKPITEPEKVWTITFNDDVNERANLDSIYIISADKEKHDVSITISADSKQVKVKPKKPYLFGTDYTLIVPKGFESAKGNKLKADVTKHFKLQGTQIETISANWNSLVTNIIVTGTTDVAKVTVSFSNMPEKELKRRGTKFDIGMRGLLTGDQFTIYTYNEQGKLLETQYYEVK